MPALHFICVLVGLLIAALLGADIGRLRERRTLLSPVIPASGERRLHDVEYVLRKQHGLPEMHPDPEHAARLRQIRFIK